MAATGGYASPLCPSCAGAGGIHPPGKPVIPVELRRRTRGELDPFAGNDPTSRPRAPCQEKVAEPGKIPGRGLHVTVGDGVRADVLRASATMRVSYRLRACSSGVFSFARGRTLYCYARPRRSGSTRPTDLPRPGSSSTLQPPADSGGGKYACLMPLTRGPASHDRATARTEAGAPECSRRAGLHPRGVSPGCPS